MRPRRTSSVPQLWNVIADVSRVNSSSNDAGDIVIVTCFTYRHTYWSEVRAFLRKHSTNKTRDARPDLEHGGRRRRPGCRSCQGREDSWRFGTLVQLTRMRCTCNSFLRTSSVDFRLSGAMREIKENIVSRNSWRHRA